MTKRRRQLCSGLLTSGRRLRPSAPGHQAGPPRQPSGPRRCSEQAWAPTRGAMLSASQRTMKGHADRLLVRGHLVHTPVLSPAVAIVRCEHDQRVCQLPRLLERGEHVRRSPRPRPRATPAGPGAARRSAPPGSSAALAHVVRLVLDVVARSRWASARRLESGEGADVSRRRRHGSERVVSVRCLPARSRVRTALWLSGRTRSPPRRTHLSRNQPGHHPNE